jgi:hypothetical protein
MESAIAGWEDSPQASQSVAKATDRDLAKYQEWFIAAEEASQEAREKSERDRDYYDGKQLTDTELQELDRRGQPAIIINRVKRKIDYLLGHERATRTDPRAYPRTQTGQGAAEAVTDALRYVCDSERFDVKRSSTWENMLVEGHGGVEVGARKNARGEIEPTIHHVPWDRIFYDPHSRMLDFSDARYLGIVIWKDKEEVEEDFPDKAALVSATLDAVPSKTYDDKPTWADGKRKRVRVVQMYYKKKGVWYLCFFVKAGFLRDPKPVEYLDEDGEPECPLLLQSAYIDRDNARYGVVREMIGPQDEVNKRRSKALHLISVRQTVSEIGAVENVADAKRELAKPDGHIVVAPGMRFELLDTSDMAISQFNLLKEAKDEIDLLGPNASMMGKDDKAPSGRAILAQQQGGTIELGPLSDALRQWQWRVYRCLWHRIKQYWQAEKWIRVTDDESNLKWVGLNTPITQEMQTQQNPEEQQAVEQVRQLVAQANPGAMPQFEQQMQAQMQTQVGVNNSVAELDVDIILQDSPDLVTIQTEQFDQLAQLFGALPPGTIPIDVLIEASSLRESKKKTIMERLEQQQQQPPPDPMLQASNEATVRKTQSEAAKNEAQAAKTMAEAELDGQMAQVPMAPRGEPDPNQQGAMMQ